LADELVADAAGAVVFNIDAHADDMVVVAQEALGDGLGVASIAGDFQMDATDDHFGGQGFGAGRDFWVFHRKVGLGRSRKVSWKLSGTFPEVMIGP